MAWCRQATSRYLNQYWPSSPTPYGVTRPQWVIKVSNLYFKMPRGGCPCMSGVLWPSLEQYLRIHCKYNAQNAFFAFHLNFFKMCNYRKKVVLLKRYILGYDSSHMKKSKHMYSGVWYENVYCNVSHQYMSLSREDRWPIACYNHHFQCSGNITTSNPDILQYANI